MDRTLTALARARYRPARWSALGSPGVAAGDAERLARDVSLRWEEAAEAFLAALRAPGRREVSGRPAERAGGGRDESRGGTNGGAGAARMPRGAGQLAGARAPWLEEIEEDILEEAPFPEAEERPPGERRLRRSRDPEGLADWPATGRPHARDAPGESGEAESEADHGAEPPVRSGTDRGRPAGHDAPARSGGGRQDTGTLPLPREPSRVAAGTTAPWNRERRPAGGVPVAAPAGGPVMPAGPVRPLRSRRPDPAPGRALPWPSHAAGAFALERLLDERRRRDESLEEWKRTEF